MLPDISDSYCLCHNYMHNLLNLVNLITFTPSQHAFLSFFRNDEHMGNIELTQPSTSADNESRRQSNDNINIHVNAGTLPFKYNCI